MSVDTRIYTALQAHSPLTDIVGTSCYPVLAPQDATLPFVTWQEISAEHTPTHDTIGKPADRSMQFSCWSATIAGARTLRTAVIDAIAASEAQSTIDFGGSVYRDTTFDQHNPHYNASIDINMWDNAL